MNIERGKLYGHASVATVMIIWGLTFIAIKIALRDVGPSTIALIRFTIASTLLYPIAKLRFGKRRVSPPWGKLSLMGLTGVVGAVVLEQTGLLYTSASSASLILSSMPVVTAILSAAFIGERITAFKGIGIALSMLGVFLVIGAERSETSFITGSLGGGLLVFGAAVSWGVYTVIGKSLSPGMHYLLITTYSILIGTILLTPLAAYEYLDYGFTSISPESWAALLFLGALASAAGYFLYNYGLKHIGAGQAAIYANLSPLVAILAGVFYLGESLQILQVLGGALILFGVFIYGR